MIQLKYPPQSQANSLLTIQECQIQYEQKTSVKSFGFYKIPILPDFNIISYPN